MRCHIWCWVSLATIFIFVNPAYAQDERVWRKLLTGELGQEAERPQIVPKYVFNGPTYRFDLDGDGTEEGLVLSKRDLIDWVEIHAADGRKIFEGKLAASGINARVDRIRIVDLSNDARVLIISYFEGKTENRRLEALARLWFITIDRHDLKTLALTRGPVYWHEFEGMRHAYGRRLYALGLRDFDGDGRKDVRVAYNHIMSIWRYRGDGKWLSN